MTVKIEIQGNQIGGLCFNPEPHQCAVVVRDEDGNFKFCQPFRKPDNITFEELYKLNEHPFIIETIYVSGLQVGMKSNDETCKRFVAHLLKKNDIDSLKEWCEIK